VAGNLAQGAVFTVMVVRSGLLRDTAFEEDLPSRPGAARAFPECADSCRSRADDQSAQIDRSRGETRHATWSCAVIALGFDRLVVLCTGAHRIEDVL
jgi:elongation factor P--beta-lysine ligase